jgi:hypothetical protein
LRGLKLYLEPHCGTPRVVAWARCLRQEAPKSAWGRLMAADALLAEGSLDNVRVGGRYRFVTAAGDAFEGEVHAWIPDREFAGTVENWNHGMLRIQLDELPLRKTRDVNLWLQTWACRKKRCARWRRGGRRCWSACSLPRREEIKRRGRRGRRG